MSSDSGNSQATRGGQLRDIIQSLMNRPVSTGGRNGYFVSKQTLSQFEEELEDMMAGKTPTSVSPTVLMDMHNQLNDARRQLGKAEERLRHTQNELDATKKTIAEQEGQLAAQEKVAAGIYKKIEEAKQPLVKQVKDLRAQLDGVRKSSNTSPEEAEILSKRLKSAQAELEVLNKERKVTLDQIRGQKDTISAFKSKLDALELSASLQQHDEFPPLKPMEKLDPMPEPESATLRKALPPKLMSEVLKEATATRKSLRDKAFELMELANKKDPRNYVGYRQYAKALFNLVKDTPAHKRGKFANVIVDLGNSMSSQTGKKLQQIRHEYASLFNPTKEEQEKIATKVQDRTASWWQSIKYDFWVAGRTAKVSFKLALAKMWQSSQARLESLESKPSSLWSAILKGWHTGRRASVRAWCWVFGVDPTTSTE
jgi:hypothetical protein